jgi:hypothetical protein
MQKLEDVVTHTQKSFNDVDFLFPKEIDFDEFIQISSYEPFDDKAIGYLDALSRALLKDIKARNFPDVITFAFYCRKSNIFELKKRYSQHKILKLGRGLVFHISPSNVPVNFAYSLLSGILSGNLNIVKVPSKYFEQIDIVINAIELLSKNSSYNFISHRQVLVRYERQSSATAFFSSICDVRIIWGGDSTINQIRKNSIPTRAFDITFADRYSICLINACKYLKETDQEKIALYFYNDTFLFDQNACTAPHLVIWLGSEKIVKSAKEMFWAKLHQLVKLKYKLQSIVSVDKLTSLYKQAIDSKGIRKVNSCDNLIWRIELEDLNKNIDEFRCTNGYFSEYNAKTIKEVSKIVNRKYQTLAYYGVERNELEEFIKQEKPSGIDRIVPIGKTMEFSLDWDGHDLISSLSRSCEII